RGEVDRDDGDARARRDVRHVPPAPADEARAGARRRALRLLLVRGERAGARGEGRRRGPGRGRVALLSARITSRSRRDASSAVTRHTSAVPNSETILTRTSGV